MILTAPFHLAYVIFTNAVRISVVISFLYAICHRLGIINRLMHRFIEMELSKVGLESISFLFFLFVVSITPILYLCSKVSVTLDISSSHVSYYLFHFIIHMYILQNCSSPKYTLLFKPTKTNKNLHFKIISPPNLQTHQNTHSHETKPMPPQQT